jgi:hypothetical protein
MLATILELEQIIVHTPGEVPWNALPARAVLQLHWLPEEPFVSLLEQHAFRVIVLGRHPLDVLISILAFSQHDDSTLRWLGGDGPNERPIAGARPLDEAFLEYACGPRARRLLDVSNRWWRRPGVCPVRYETLVDDTAGELTRILAALSAAPRKSPAEVAAESTPDEMRSQNVHMLFHVWQAKRSLWRSFLTAAAARRIFAAQHEAFETLGYACDPDESLSDAEAHAAWDRHDAAAVKRHLHGVKKTLCDTLARQHREFDDQRNALAHQQAQLAQYGEQVQALRAEVEHMRRRQAEFDGLGPWSLGAARRLQRIARRFPRLAGALKSVALAARPHARR